MWLQTLAAELPITLSDGTVWLSIGQGLLIGAVCMLFGAWVARFVGLLPSDAPAGETLGVGLASGLMVLASWWAAVASGGRSSFTPVAVGFFIAIVLAAVRRRRASAGEAVEPPGETPVDVSSAPAARPRDFVVVVLGGGLFVVAVALLYGATMAPSPRDGVQPMEFRDVAYYSVLGADLATTGTESLYSPSGFAAIEGLPAQTWYHWGEAWLGAAAITIFGTAPLQARHLIVLPLLLLAAAALTGTLVRRMTGTESRGAFLFGFLACLFLAPVPLVPGGHFSSWAVGLIFEITLYGLAVVAVLLAMYALAVLDRRQESWALAAFIGSAAALILPTHLVVAILALIGVAAVIASRMSSLRSHRRYPSVPAFWRRTFVATGIALACGLVFGLSSGHGVGGSGLSPSVSPFNPSWLEAVAITTLGAGGLAAIPVAWWMVRHDASIEAGLYLGAIVIVVAGAVVWGALLGDFNTFHLFFGGIAVFATPVAAVAVWSIWMRLRATTGHARPALGLLVLCGLQMELGVGLAVGRIQAFGPGSYPPVPVQVVTAIRSLPTDAKLAYACRPMEEVAFWTAGLLGIDAHTGRRIVPMCFEAEALGELTGTEMSQDVPNPLYQWAPQRTLYPDSSTVPTATSVLAFLKANGIDYIYADTLHPNSLVPAAVPVATTDSAQILRIP